MDLNLILSDLAGFFQQLHAFDVPLAVTAGVPVSCYAFGMQNDHWRAGDAQLLYRRDLDAYRASPVVDAETAVFLEVALDGHLLDLHVNPGASVLLRGEVSLDHVLLDLPSGRVSGVIDFNGMVVGRPARDFLYLYEVFGQRWTARLLDAYGLLESAAVLRELHFLHVWHTLLRLQWAQQHQVESGVARQRELLGALRSGPVLA